jgi:hypothetical protein
MERRPEPEHHDAGLRHALEQSEKLLTGGESARGDGEYDDSDPATYWGKRLGWIIGYAVLAFLIWHLFSTYLMA